MNDKGVQVTSHESGVTYTAGKHIGGTGTFTLYECSSSGGSASSTEAGRCCILKIAASPEHNGVLDREALVLRRLYDAATRLECEFAQAKPMAKKRLNYQFMFPNSLATFVSEEQMARRILILGLGYAADRLSDLVPLNFLELRRGVRIDRRTSAWVLGKSLKVLSLAHGIGIMNRNVCRDNILINITERNHGVALFDWSQATIGQRVDEKGGAEEIAKLAQAVIFALRGDASNGNLPSEETDFQEYDEFIRMLALGREGDAFKAHQDFYRIVRRIWKKEYYPFTTYPIK
jgi:hypothetical protein